MTANSIILFSNQSATGSSVFMDAEGGRYQMFAEGTFGGTTLTLDGQGPNDTTIAGISGVSVTAATAGGVEIMLARGERVRGTLTGGSPSGLYARLVKVSD
jgi:hypothetical protein